MIRKSILALTAIAALGTVALAPTSASAWGFKGGWGHHGFGAVTATAIASASLAPRPM